MTTPRNPRTVAGAVALLALPPMLALGEAVSFYARNRSSGTIVSSGLEREYLLHVPASYDAGRPTPLVITLHGGAMRPRAQMQASQWNRVADEHGFIVVYPSGLTGDGPRHWRADGDPDQVLDVRFIGELIDTLAAHYTIDRARVHANGLSNGGGMAFVLACTMPDRIAAVGLVGAAIFLPWRLCPDHRPVPLIAFHGTADSAAYYTGGLSWVARQRLPNIPAWTAEWARRNRCDGSAERSAVAADVTRLAWTSCAEGAAVVLYTILEGGHTWPGGDPLPAWFVGTTTRSVDASREMWAFFRDHPLPPVR